MATPSFEVAFPDSRAPNGGSTTLHFGLVFVQRRFDGGFQSRAAIWLEDIPEGTGAYSTIHRPVIRMRGEKDNRHLEITPNGDCGDDAVDASGERDVHKNQVRPL